MNRGAFSGFNADSPARFDSGLLPWPDSGAPHSNPFGAAVSLAINHGLGATPSQVRWVWVCAYADAGYFSGDEVDISGGQVSGAVQWSRWANAGSVGLAIPNQTVNIPHKITGASTGMTALKWNLRCYAVR